MGVNNRGYIYTLVTVGAVLIIFSLVLFYFNIEEYPIEEAITRMAVDEIHYFVESVRKDCGRSVSITGQRAATYAVNYVIEENESLRDYVMHNCTGFNYHVNGSQAAIIELMYCGTLHGDSSGPAGYMENHTLRDWVTKIMATSRNMSYRLSIRFRNMSIAPFDAWHFTIISRWDIIVGDKINRTYYAGRDIPIVSIVPLNTLEDPAFHMHGGVPAVYRYMHKCPDFEEVNASVLDLWIDDGCYLAKDNSFNAPSFFDRLDGRKTLSMKYVKQSNLVASQLSYNPRAIGMESLLNLDQLGRFNVTVKFNNTHVDYLYWLDTKAYCRVNGMSHSRFRIDTLHALDYRPVGLECGIIVSNQTGVDVFTPAAMTVPVDTIISWSNPDESPHLLAIMPDVWEGSIDLPAGSTFSWEFENPAVYTVKCLTTGHGGTENLITVLD